MLVVGSDGRSLLIPPSSALWEGQPNAGGEALFPWDMFSAHQGQRGAVTWRRQKSGRCLATEPLASSGPTVPQEGLSRRPIGLPGRPSISTDKGRPSDLL